MTDHKELPNGWKEAAIAWEVCASIHRKYAKGKDALFTARQADYIKHTEDARAALVASQPTVQGGASVEPSDALTDAMMAWAGIDGFDDRSPEWARIKRCLADQISAQAEKARGVPERWKLMPPEATEEMCDAAEAKQTRHLVEDAKRGGHDQELGYRAIYKAMHAAAPQAPHVEPVSAADPRLYENLECKAAPTDRIAAAQAPAVAEGDVRDAALEEAARTVEGYMIGYRKEDAPLLEISTAILALRTAPAKQSVDLVEAIKGLPLPTPCWARDHHGEAEVYVAQDIQDIINAASALVAKYLEGK